MFFSLALHFASLGAYNVEIYDHENLKYLLLLHLHKSPKYVICLFQIRMYGESKARTEQTFRIAHMNCKASGHGAEYNTLQPTHVSDKV